MLLIPSYIVDSFTKEAFKGNPAGVCLLENELQAQQMLSIAAELNLSETAFVSKIAESGAFPIRYFSPKMEIPLCGHATLAAARVLFQQNPCKQVNFITHEGVNLPVQLSHGGIRMTFPRYDTRPAKVPGSVLSALGIDEIANCEFNNEMSILLLEILGTDALQALKPDFNALVNAADSLNGVLVTAKSHDGVFDFHSRYFWPWSGTNEDPVTGGTHTFLAGYWAGRLGKTKLQSFQSSARTGSMEVEVVDDGSIAICGHACIVFEGQLLLQEI